MKAPSVCKRKSWLAVVAVVVLVVNVLAAVAQEKTAESTREKTPVREWLLLGPMAVPFPAFNDEGKPRTETGDLLAYEHVARQDLTPVAGSAVNTFRGQATWVRVTADTAGVRLPVEGKLPLVAYLAAYIQVPRWTKIELGAGAKGPFEITIDGAAVVTEKKGGGLTGGEKTGEAKLGTGKHLLLVKAVYVPGDSAADWRVNVRIASAKDFVVEPAFSIEPMRTINVADILDGPMMENVDISPDGELFSVTLRKRTPPAGDAESWVEIRRFADGKRIETLRDMQNASSWQWAPVGHKLSYVVKKDGAGTIRMVDLDTGVTETIVKSVEDLSGYDWSPDGSFLVYSADKKAEADKTGLKRFLGVADRREGERDRSSLYLATVPAGMTRKLTGGEHSTYVYDIHPDGRSVLVGRTYEDLTERPYTMTEMVLLDLESQTTKLLHKGHWINSAVWSPDGKKILIIGGPSAFGKIGLNVPEGTVPNDYDGQLYLFDPETKAVEALTREFDPAVGTVFWPKPGGEIYLVAEAGENVKFFRYNVRKKTFREIELPCEVVHESDLSRDASAAVLTGSSANQPWRMYAVDLKNGKVRMLLDPTVERFRYIELGKVEPWSFTASSGKTIVGRVHYPPDFDPARKWPCVVNFYGGTSPIDRSFGTRYPKDLWTANGYVVYVLQPSGATGFGQAFSAFHVNDWGKIVSGEIIEGVQAFLKAHPFVDPQRVGCIGASFGGFMTELLVTKTDIFAAAVSHAGISSISSYWGEGYWGYEYNAVSAAESFPWNRPDIYIEQSPLFAADKVTTPLLLLHGAADTNVPPGESDQMYAALKLLGKEVEYIKVADQNHFVLDYKKRIMWSDAIVAWFDRWLKDEPEWWNDMYPSPEGKTVTKPAEIGVHRVELEKYGTTLLGNVTKADIDAALPDWYGEMLGYAADPGVVSELSNYILDLRFTIILGTWCSDSIREIPRLWRIFEESGYPADTVELFAVGSSRFTKEMQIPGEVLDWSNNVKAYYGIELVPTIIVTRDGKELGRIVETPKETLEKDLLAIVKK